MDTRHNTALLEQAIALVVQRASIPAKRAEAEAAEKLARAAARRRLATGAAIALAAVGVGLGVYLGLWRPRAGSEQVVTIPQAPPSERLAPEGVSIQQKTKEPAISVSRESVSQRNPHGPVIDYDKFVTQESDYLSRRWQIVAGHHYATDTDKEWSNAWCYTKQTDADGALINVDLALRESPGSQPRAPIASAETLRKVGLNDSSALDLAAKCSWLDGRAYASYEFSAPLGRNLPSPTSTPNNPSVPAVPIRTPSMPSYVAKDGFDLIGYDLPNMPISADDQSACESKCNDVNGCMAYVYNKPYKKCFLKSGVGTLFQEDMALTGYKDTLSGVPNVSSLKFYKNAGFAGTLYKDLANFRYMDCQVECDRDQNCIAFDFDYKEKQCTMLRNLNSSNPIPMPTVSSGVKASFQ